jgi:hypothetical protein
LKAAARLLPAGIRARILRSRSRSR